MFFFQPSRWGIAESFAVIAGFDSSILGGSWVVISRVLSGVTIPGTDDPTYNYP